MRILVYKRTHPGDPDNGGCFGAEDCMGAIRARRFDAVIGVGGIGAEAQSHRIDGKLNWIGIGPRRGRWYGRGPLLTFDRFRDFGTRGVRLASLAPVFARRVYGRRLRHLMSDSMSETELREVEEILSLARGAPASIRVSPFRRWQFSNRCRPICKPVC